MNRKLWFLAARIHCALWKKKACSFSNWKNTHMRMTVTAIPSSFISVKSVRRSIMSVLTLLGRTLHIELKTCTKHKRFIRALYLRFFFRMLTFAAVCLIDCEKSSLIVDTNLTVENKNPRSHRGKNARCNSITKRYTSVWMTGNDWTSLMPVPSSTANLETLLNELSSASLMCFCVDVSHNMFNSKTKLISICPKKKRAVNEFATCSHHVEVHFTLTVFIISALFVVCGFGHWAMDAESLAEQFTQNSFCLKLINGR